MKATARSTKQDRSILNKQAFVSLLTPAGRGAVATVVVGGQDCVARVAARFDAACGRPLDELAVDRVYFGRWRSGDGLGEEVVVCRRSDWVEIHGHGGHAAPASIIQSLVEDGCHELAWPRFLSQTTSDPFAAEACLALTQARTERTAAILMDQWRGVLREQWEGIIRRIESGSVPIARESIEALLQRSRIGLHLTQPYRVVLCGPPNVGKSTLINALLGYQRSIVYDQPGTTRDVLTAHTALEGWPIELSDTAGLNDYAVGVEARGVEQSRRHLDKADLILFVVDASRPSAEITPIIGGCQQTLTVYNKIDMSTGAVDAEAILTSARTGEGLDHLVTAIIASLVPCPPAPRQAVPFADRQVAALRASRNELIDGRLQEAAAILRAAAGVAPTPTA